MIYVEGEGVTQGLEVKDVRGRAGGDAYTRGTEAQAENLKPFLPNFRARRG